MKFLIDVQLPGTLTRWLRGRGCEADHALDRDLGQVSDLQLWRLVAEEDRIMISNDEDLFILATRHNDQGEVTLDKDGQLSDVHVVDQIKSILAANLLEFQCMLLRRPL